MSVSSVFELINKIEAWSPSLSTMEAWNQWAEGVEVEPFEKNAELKQTPSVSFLPLSLRKKLSAVAKVGLHLMQESLDESQKGCIPIVMSSRHGESQLTVDILGTIARSEQTSPMAFCRSVHNSTVGVFSIANRNKNRNMAMSAMEFSFGMGLIETVTQLYADDSIEEILYVYVDEAVPVPFQAFISDPPVNYGAAFLIEKKPMDNPVGNLLEGVAQVECLSFLQLALASV